MIEGLSKRGNVSHSTDPEVSTSAAEWQSDSRAWSAMGVPLMRPHLRSSSAMPGGRDIAPASVAGALLDLLPLDLVGAALLVERAAGVVHVPAQPLHLLAAHRLLDQGA